MSGQRHSDCLMKPLRSSATTVLLIFGLLCATSPTVCAIGQKQRSSSASSQMTPVRDGGAGPCSLELPVSHDGKPAVAANVKVHIAYGFAGVRKLGLDA